MDKTYWFIHHGYGEQLLISLCRFPLPLEFCRPLFFSVASQKLFSPITHSRDVSMPDYTYCYFPSAQMEILLVARGQPFIVHTNKKTW